MAGTVNPRLRFAAVAIVFIIIATVFFPLSSPTAQAAEIISYGDARKINVVVRTHTYYDEYGRPLVNPDGSFYPNDEFKVEYRAFFIEDIFEGVEAVYDKSAFEMVWDRYWGGVAGSGRFRVKYGTPPGLYDFSVRAWGKTVFNRGSSRSGEVTVTYGGVDVDAYYRNQYRLKIKVNNPEWGTTNPAPSGYWYGEGASVSVTAIANEGYRFQLWLLDGKNAGTSNPITVKMNAPHTLEAVFAKFYKLAIRVNPPEGGTTDYTPGDHWFPAGESVTVTATPNDGYEFDYWELDGSDVGASNPITVVMDSNHVLDAFFRELNSTAMSLVTAYAPQKTQQVGWSAGSSGDPKLVIKNLRWRTRFDLFRGTVCSASGDLFTSNGYHVSNNKVVVEFHKVNVFTGVKWITSKTVRTGANGHFVADDACTPFAEAFIGVKAWAEKPGYEPTWHIYLSLYPESASIEQGAGYVVGLNVHLYGRYSEVPIQFFTQGMPVNCETTFYPAIRNVDGIDAFDGGLFLRVGENVELGDYSFAVTVTSNHGVGDSKQFRFKVVECTVKEALSKVKFTARTSGGSVINDALQALKVDWKKHNAPVKFNWNVDSKHSYEWFSTLRSTVEGKRYVFKKAVVTEHYVSVATIKVEVAEYDPRFTTLAYTVPKSSGNDSFEKPFAMIVRYDGNGPEHRLDQRAVIEDFGWYGYASRRWGTEVFMENITQEPINFTSLLGNESSVVFSASGIDVKADGTILRVDGEGFGCDVLPKTFVWEVGSNHTFKWIERLDALKIVGYDRFQKKPIYGKAEGEWYGWEFTAAFPPQLDLSEMNENMSESEMQSMLQGKLLQLISSPSGNVTVSPLGNRVMGSYAHNKLLKKIAENVGKSEDEVVANLTGFPVYFDNETRYAKFMFDLDDDVMHEALRQKFNSSAYIEIHFKNYMFYPAGWTKTTHTANFTCPYEFYRKHINITAWRWDPLREDWAVDYAAASEARFDTAFNFTDKDAMVAWFGNQTDDEEMLKLACEDLYECPPQFFIGSGVAEGVLKRTGPMYYNLNITAGHAFRYVGIRPGDLDAWTESLESDETMWEGTSGEVGLSSNSVAGKASISVSAENLTTAGAILTFYPGKGPEGTRLMTLHFSIFLDKGCTGKVTVHFSNETDPAAASVVVPTGVWSHVSVNVPFEMRRGVSKVGIYCDLSAEGSGGFLVDELYFTNVYCWEWSEDSVNLERTIQMDFRSNETCRIYVNLDPLSPLLINVSSEGCKDAVLLLNATPQLGGLVNMSVYVVTEAPTDYTLGDVPIDRLKLRLLKTENLTLLEVKPKGISGYEYYRGYAPIHETVLGFQGMREVLIRKDPDMVALPYYNKTLLYIEAENVWGTKFHVVVAVQPYEKTFWELAFEELATYVVWIVIAAIIISITVYLVKGEQPRLFPSYTSLMRSVFQRVKAFPCSSFLNSRPLKFWRKTC